jgi:hypothetical protein
MNILTPAIKKRIQSGIIENIARRAYHQVSRQISDILGELYAGIPDKNRASYGIVYTIKVLSEYLYTQLAQTGAPVQEVAAAIYAESDDRKPKFVALGIMSFLGLGSLKRLLATLKLLRLLLIGRCAKWPRDCFVSLLRSTPMM